MRKRHRHFKPRSVGATVAYDSRYINQSDGTAVSTWSDMSGNGRDLSQSTSSKQPTYKTGIQGGAGVVRFDGSGDALSTPSYSVSNVVSGLIVYKTTQATDAVLFERSSNFNLNTWCYVVITTFLNTNSAVLWSTRTTGGSSYMDGRFIVRSQEFNISQFNYNGSTASHTFLQNGIELTKSYPTNAPSNGTGISASLPSFVGARGGSSLYLNGDIGIIYTINADIGNPMRNRLNHHAALAFKIQCS